jgi:nucleoside-specific outer membrane channel protein Tsx
MFTLPFVQRSIFRAAVISASVTAAIPSMVHAADWSDTSISARYGSSFAEPYDNNADGSRKDIKKGILALTHVSGYKYGTNFLNVDMLASDHNDPAGGVAGSSGAREVYAVYRHMLDLGKVSGKEFKFGPVRGVGVTAGFDFNTKNDGYASKKQMLVAGPTLMLDVPGFANLSALAFRESNAPGGISRYYYKTHGALELDWGIPVGSLPLSFNGYALYIGSKGQNEFGGSTAPETHIDMTLMYDAGVMMGLPKHTALIGLEYEYWKNKFGNPVADAGPGAFAHTPMVRAEYHF